MTHRGIPMWEFHSVANGWKGVKKINASTLIPASNCGGPPTHRLP
jgi:hypothetical protein